MDKKDNTFGRRPGTCAVRFAAAAVLACSTWHAAQAQQVFVGPAFEAACQYHSIQQAVDDAISTGHFNNISVSSHWIATNDALVVNNSNPLTIEGGFDCSTGSRNGQSVMDGANAPAGSPVINHGGTAKLTVEHMVIDNGTGGGIVSSTPAPLTLIDVTLSNNSGIDGAGLSLIGRFNVAEKPVLLLGTEFIGNKATANGGAINAVYSHIDIESGFQSDNTFILNTAQGDGGAIWALDSDLTINTHSASSNVAFMSSNSAVGKGGAMYLLHVQNAGLDYIIKNDDPTRPLRFFNNSAAQGGVIYMISQPSVDGDVTAAFLTMTNTVMTQNNADQGAAIFASAIGRDTSNPAVAQNKIVLEQSDEGGAIPACVNGLQCNDISGNTSAHNTFEFNGSAHGANILDVTHAYLRNNSGGELISGNSAVSIDGSLITNNTTSTLASILQAGGSLVVSNSTVAGNTGGGAMFNVNGGSALTLLHDIVFQPTNTNYVVGAGVTVTLHDLLVGSFAGLPADIGGLNIQVTADPSFADAAHGDYHLQRSSSAVDRWAPNGVATPATDLDHGSRPVTQAQGSPTPYDFGAYEFGALRNEVFLGKFE
jgi:hypothetical protein